MDNIIDLINGTPLQMYTIALEEQISVLTDKLNRIPNNHARIAGCGEFVRTFCINISSNTYFNQKDIESLFDSEELSTDVVIFSSYRHWLNQIVIQNKRYLSIVEVSHFLVKAFAHLQSESWSNDSFIDIIDLENDGGGKHFKSMNLFKNTFVRSEKCNNKINHNLVKVDKIRNLNYWLHLEKDNMTLLE
jgi:hypothetical protein